MRHRKQGKILGRKRGPRKALMRNLAISLITNEKIVTTEAKAKALRPQIEKMITKARDTKDRDLAIRRNLLSALNHDDAVRKLLGDIAPRFVARAGGYTRIIKLPTRKGDGAKMAQIEFTELPKKIIKKLPKKSSAGASKKNVTAEREAVVVKK